MENNAEIWKDIIGFEGLYQISNYGNIKSCERYVNAKFGKRVVNEKILSLGKDRDGYLMAILCQYGTKKQLKYIDWLQMLLLIKLMVRIWLIILIQINQIIF